MLDPDIKIIFEIEAKLIKDYMTEIDILKHIKTKNEL